MADQQIKIEIAALKKSVEQSDDRTRTLGTKLENLKDYVYQELKVDVAIVKDRTALLMWLGGIAFTALFGTMIFLGTQLFQINGKLAGLDQQTQNLAKTVSGMRLTQLSGDPNNPQNIEEAKQVLSDAKTAKVNISPSIIEQTGKKFVQAADKTPNAWQAALEFVDYRSFLNTHVELPEKFYGDGVQAPKTINQTVIHINPVDGHALPLFIMSIARVPIADAAILEPLDFRIPQASPDGPHAYLGVGGDLYLDNSRMRNVVLENVAVHYAGGPMILENVTFINCTFIIENVDNGRAFGNQLLASESVSFKTNT